MVATREREYYTVAEAAAELDVSPSTVWRWIAAKRLPAYRVGARKIRIDKDDLANVIGDARPGAPSTREESAETRSADGYVFVRPSEEELARRRAVVQQILASQQGRSIAPLTSADLVRRVRDEREERYREWLKLSS